MRQKGANGFLTNLNGGDKKCRIKIGVLRAVAAAAVAAVAVAATTYTGLSREWEFSKKLRQHLSQMLSSQICKKMFL